ncbi:MAG TPA: hypothetical protein VME67_06320 [Mycobacterium sp.]|nr:hypothetical protein [Mycobacterium sp.]HTX94480.1 hypothetical protein [Mycobacterium sp.]
MHATGRRDNSVGGHQVAQAVKLIHALQFQLVEMGGRLAWIERQNVTHSHSQACALRSEAAALRRDIDEAQMLIDRLKRRYLSNEAHRNNMRVHL